MWRASLVAMSHGPRHRSSADTLSLLESLPTDIFSLLLANMVESIGFTLGYMTRLTHARAVLFAPLSRVSKTLQCAMQEHLLEVAVQYFLIRLGSLVLSYREDYGLIAGLAWRNHGHRPMRRPVRHGTLGRPFMKSICAAVQRSDAISLVQQISSTQTLSDNLKWLELEIGPNAYRFVKHNGKYWQNLLTHHRRSRQTLARLWNIVLKAFEDIAAGTSTFGGLLAAAQAVDNWIERVEGVSHSYMGEINIAAISKAERAMKRRDDA